MSLAVALKASMEVPELLNPIKSSMHAAEAHAVTLETQSAMAFEDAENYELTNDYLTRWDPTKPSPTNSIDQARSLMYVNQPPVFEQNFGKVGEWKDNSAQLRNVKDGMYMPDYQSEPFPAGVNAKLHKPRTEPGFIALPRNF